MNNLIQEYIFRVLGKVSGIIRTDVDVVMITPCNGSDSDDVFKNFEDMMVNFGYGYISRKGDGNIYLHFNSKELADSFGFAYAHK